MNFTGRSCCRLTIAAFAGVRYASKLVTRRWILEACVALGTDVAVMSGTFIPCGLLTIRAATDVDHALVRVHVEPCLTGLTELSAPLRASIRKGLFVAIRTSAWLLFKAFAGLQEILVITTGTFVGIMSRTVSSCSTSTVGALASIDFAFSFFQMIACLA